MKNKNLFLIASLCGISILTAGCTMCPSGAYHGKHHEQGMHEKKHEKHQHKQKNHGEPVVFQQTYGANDVHNVKAKMYTRSASGGNTEMGFVNFKETEDGLKMNVDLVYLRPGKTYTAQVYQCGACNDSMCCDTEAMSIDLPQLTSANGDRLQQSYIVRGLTAAQLNNAKFILTRDGGYQAAWGTLNQ